MPASRIFLDLDRTLYDTDRMWGPIERDLLEHGYSLEQIAASEPSLDEGYTFEKHLRNLGFAENFIPEKIEKYNAFLRDGDAYLFTGVAEALRELAKSAELSIVTYGIPGIQSPKLEGIRSFKPLFSSIHIVQPPLGSKGEVIRSYGEHPETFFVDDSPRHLMDVLEKAPWTKVARMMWPEANRESHEGDDAKWPVVRSMEELKKLLEG